MSNKSITYAECTACKVAGRETNSVQLLNHVPVSVPDGWVTVFGPLNGTVFNLPVTPAPVVVGQPARNVPLSPTHFCPACALALGLDKIQAAVTPAAKAVVS